MTPTCPTCTHYETALVSMGGRAFTAEMCGKLRTTTALARMAWTDRGLPSKAEHCGPSGAMWRAG